jgi:hypothetical protein
MAWNNTQPPNTQAVGYGAQRIRELKTDLEGLGDKEHFFDSTLDAATGWFLHKPGSAKALYGTFVSLPATGTSYDWASNFVAGNDYARLYVVQEAATYTGTRMGCTYFDDPINGWTLIASKRSHWLDGYFSGSFTVVNGSTTVTLTSTPVIDTVHGNNVAVGDLFAFPPAGSPTPWWTAPFYRVASITNSTHFEIERVYAETGGTYAGHVFYNRPFFGFLDKATISRSVPVAAGIRFDGVDVGSHMHDGTAGNGLALTAGAMTALPAASIPNAKLVTQFKRTAVGTYVGNDLANSFTVGFTAAFIIISETTGAFMPVLWQAAHGTNVKRFDGAQVAVVAAMGATDFSFNTTSSYMNNTGETYAWFASE